MPPYVSWIADAVSILAAVFALMGWIQSRRVRNYLEKERQRMNRRITIELKYDTQSQKLPGELRREDLSRAEVLGVLGMIPMKKPGNRYHLNYLNTHNFYDRLNEISEAEGDSVFTIPCSEEEFSQFILESAEQKNSHDPAQL